jgi:RND family efflux transporter MFP subunit
MPADFAPAAPPPGRRPVALALLTLAAAGLAAAANPAAATAPAGAPAAAGPVTVPTVAVEGSSLAAARRHEAVLEPVRQALVTAQTAGRVLVLPVRAGDRVRRGQPLARLDDRDAAAGERAGAAAVAQAEAQLRQAELTLQRQRSLAAAGFVSPAAVEIAETQGRSAEAALNEARARRTQADVVRGFAELAAPFDGVVLATHAEVGDLALPGRPVATVYEPARLRAVVSLPASGASAIPADPAAITVLLDDGRRIAPVRSELLPATDPVSQTLTWRLELPAGTGDLRPGQAARILVDPARTRGAAAAAAPPAPARPTLPVSAVLRRGELTAVYVAQGDGFVLRPVRLAPPVGDRVPVLAGVTVGESVAVDPVRAGLAGARPAAAR